MVLPKIANPWTLNHFFNMAHISKLWIMITSFHQVLTLYKGPRFIWLNFPRVLYDKHLYDHHVTSEKTMDFFNSQQTKWLSINFIKQQSFYNEHWVSWKFQVNMIVLTLKSWGKASHLIVNSIRNVTKMSESPNQLSTGTGHHFSPRSLTTLIPYWWSKFTSWGCQLRKWQ